MNECSSGRRHSCTCLAQQADDGKDCCWWRQRRRGIGTSDISKEQGYRRAGYLCPCHQYAIPFRYRGLFHAAQQGQQDLVCCSRDFSPAISDEVRRSKENSAFAASVYTPPGTEDPQQYAWPYEHPLVTTFQKAAFKVLTGPCRSFHNLPPVLCNVAEHGKRFQHARASNQLSKGRRAARCSH